MRCLLNVPLLCNQPDGHTIYERSRINVLVLRFVYMRVHGGVYLHRCAIFSQNSKCVNCVELLEFLDHIHELLRKIATRCRIYDCVS